MTEVELLRARVAELEVDLKAQLCIDATLVSNNDDLRAQNAALVEALYRISGMNNAVLMGSAARAALARSEGQGRQG